MQSPCVGVCRVDSDFVCEGCGRTVEEIMHWQQMTDNERRAVIDRVFARSQTR